MDNDSPFANRDVPIIGQPQILNVVAIGLIQCNCEAHPLLMEQIGRQPFTCPSCGKTWMVQAQLQVAVQQVIAKTDSPIIEG